MGKSKRKPVPEIIKAFASDESFSMTMGLPGDSMSARAERREALEKIVRPFAEKEPPADHRWGIGFTLDGSTRYVDMQKADNYVTMAAAALQRLLLLEKAIASENIDEAVRQAYGLGYFDYEIDTFATYGKFASSIVLEDAERRAMAVRNARKTAKWDQDIENLARPLLDEVKSSNVSPTAAYRRLAVLLKTRHGVEISADTIKRHLPLPDHRAKQR